MKIWFRYFKNLGSDFFFGNVGPGSDFNIRIWIRVILNSILESLKYFSFLAAETVNKKKVFYVDLVGPGFFFVGCRNFSTRIGNPWHTAQSSKDNYIIAEEVYTVHCTGQYRIMEISVVDPDHDCSPNSGLCDFIVTHIHCTYINRMVSLKIGAHIRSNLCYLICLRQWIRSRAVKSRIFFSEKTYLPLCVLNIF